MALNIWTFIDYSDNFVNVTKNFCRNHFQVVGVNGVHGPLPASGMEALVEARLRPPPPPPLPPSSAAVATRMLTFGMDRLLSSSKSSKEDREEEEELEEEEEENEGEDDAEGIYKS